MPGTPVRVDEPNQRPVPADEEVRRNPEMGNFGVVRVFRGVQGVGEELLDAGAAEPRRRQTDGVHHDEADRLARGAIVVVGRAEGAAKERGGHSPMLAGEAPPTRPRLNENAPAGPGRWVSRVGRHRRNALRLFLYSGYAARPGSPSPARKGMRPEATASRITISTIESSAAELTWTFQSWERSRTMGLSLKRN